MGNFTSMLYIEKGYTKEVAVGRRFDFFLDCDTPTQGPLGTPLQDASSYYI